MEKKEDRQESLGFLQESDTPTPQAPTAKPQQVKSPQRVSANTQKRELLENARRHHEKNWLAPADSVQEKQILRKWSKRKGLSVSDRALIYEWMGRPDGFDRRNVLFFQAAKKSVLGEFVYDTAMERHKRLSDVEWLVACFTSQGIKQKEIAELVGLKKRMVGNIISELKSRIAMESDCETDIDDRVQVARWFLGL